MQGFMKVVLIIVAFAIGGFALAVMKEVGGGYGAIGVLVALAIGAGQVNYTKQVVIERHA